MKSFVIKANDEGQRLDKFLQKAINGLPKSLMYKQIRKKNIKVNRKRADISYILSEGDVVDVYLNDEFFTDKESKDSFLNVPSKIDVVYEDENILLVNKKPGLVVHSDDSGSSDTLINRILHYLYDKGEYLPDEEQSFVPALVNRIDRNTGGIVIAVKNAAALRIMNQKVKDREVKKSYLCAVHGIPNKKSDTVTAYLKKDSNKNKVFITAKPADGAKKIITSYKVLKQKDNIALLHVDLITGRTHQIRAHMAYLGHPLVGDGKYGTNKLNKDSGFNYQALYSYKLKFDFKTDSGILEYLNHREFEIPEQDIWFLKYLQF